MAKAKSAGGSPADAVALYERLVATAPGAERKGATVPYTALNGHMFSYLSKTGIVCLRLPEREKTAELKSYFAASLAFVKTMKPKGRK